MESIENRRITRIVMKSLPTQRYRRQAVRDNLDIVGELVVVIKPTLYELKIEIYFLDFEEPPSNVLL